MQTWDLTSLDVQPHKPEVISTEDEGRAVVIELPAGTWTVLETEHSLDSQPTDPRG